MIFKIDHPEEMTPQERIQEIAAILAVGYLRMRKQFVYSSGLNSGCQAQPTNNHSNLKTTLLQDKFPAASPVYQETS